MGAAAVGPGPATDRAGGEVICSAALCSHLLDEVEPVADVVAILDQGLIRRQAPTETLRAEVKRIVFRAEDYARLDQPLPALDVCRSVDEVAVTVDNAPEILARLATSDFKYRVVDLNLDEIFEAYVVGRADDLFCPHPTGDPYVDLDGRDAVRPRRHRRSA
ncbi:MAG: hypothetical protein ACC645_25610 [Pirellulales bacterium]